MTVSDGWPLNARILTPLRQGTRAEQAYPLCGGDAFRLRFRFVHRRCCAAFS